MLKKYSTIIFVLSTLFIFGSCSKMPIYKSKDRQNLDKESGFTGYDKNSKLIWLISNDDKNLYIQIESSDQLVNQQILRGGLLLYLDTLGKRNKDLTLNFPVGNMVNRTGDRSSKNSQKHKSGGKYSNEMKIEPEIPPIAQVIRNGEVRNFNYLLEKLEYDINIYFSENSELMFDIVIPFRTLNKNGLVNINNLSVGIQTAGIKLSNSGSGKSKNQAKSGQGGGGQRGGGRGGKGKGNKQGNHGGGNAIQSVKIWFKVDLFTLET